MLDVPLWNGTTVAAVEATDFPVACTSTCETLMIVEVMVPRTRTLSPFLMALAVVEVVPFLYFVEDSSSMVTF